MRFSVPVPRLPSCGQPLRLGTELKLILPITDLGTGVAVVPAAGVHFFAWNQMLTVSAAVPPVIVAGEYPTSPVTEAQLTRPAPTTSLMGVEAGAPTATPVNARTAETPANTPITPPTTVR